MNRSEFLKEIFNIEPVDAINRFNSRTTISFKGEVIDCLFVTDKQYKGIGGNDSERSWRNPRVLGTRETIS